MSEIFGQNFKRIPMIKFTYTAVIKNLLNLFNSFYLLQNNVDADTKPT